MLIGISGHKQVGKDTFYEFARKRIQAKAPHVNVRKYAFADAVKEFAKTYFGVDTTQDKESYRFILQGIGQMMREEARKDFWIRKVLLDYAADLSEVDNLVGLVTDVRYLNEVEALLSHGDAIIRIERDVPTDMHPSERELDNYDFPVVIKNNGTLHEYQGKVIQWTDNILTSRHFL